MDNPSATSSIRYAAYYPFAMALRSDSYDINALAGETLVREFTLYQDTAQSVPFDLTGCTVSIVFNPPSMNPAATPVTLTSGSGLVISATAGMVTATQDTTGWQVGRGRWYMQVIDSAGVKSYPLRGQLFVGSP